MVVGEGELTIGLEKYEGRGGGEEPGMCMKVMHGWVRRTLR